MGGSFALFFLDLLFLLLLPPLARPPFHDPPINQFHYTFANFNSLFNLLSDKFSLPPLLLLSCS
jgi:hypothetical protein